MKQTEELFKNGKVTSDSGRGRAFANGTAFAQGTAFLNAKGKLDDDKPSSEAEKETFDWIEVRLSRLERVIDKLDQAVNNIYDSWENRNKKLDEEIKTVSDSIKTHKLAIEKYGLEAGEARRKLEKLQGNKDYVSLVESGDYKIEDFDTAGDEDLLDAIKNYQDLYEKVQDTKQEQEELREDFAKLNAQKFDNVQSQYDGILQAFDHTESMLDEYINQAEAKGHIVSKEYYKSLIDNEKDSISTLKQEQSNLLNSRQDYYNAMRKQGMSDKDIRNSQAWIDMCADIDDVTQAIEEGNTALIEYNNSIREIDWQVFDLIQERISDITSEAEFLIELMSNDKLFDDNGKLTNKGLATMGLHGQNYNTYMYQADDYGKQVAEIDSKIASGEYDKYDVENLLAKRKEYLEAQREAILNAESEKQAIKDLVSEGVELELDALQELIDKKNESLDVEKDLFEHQKKVKEQTSEIASLRKQMAAYENDDSEEAKAKVQELRVSLSEAEDSLMETEWDRYIQDTQQTLDELYTNYEETLNSRLDNIDGLISDVVNEVNSSASTIKDTLTTETDKVGTTLSSAMQNIWNTDGAANKVVSEYGKGFQGKQSTTNLTLDKIKTDVGNMVDDIDKDATTKTNSDSTQSSVDIKPSGGLSGSGSSTGGSTGGSSGKQGNNKIEIGDKVKFLSGKYYYDAQGTRPIGTRKLGSQVYVTNINTRPYATHPYHISVGKKLGSGDLGWLKKEQIGGYATGKKNFLNNEIAWTQEKGQEFIIRPSDGAILTPIAKGDSVLNAQASSNIWDLANSPAEFIRDNLNLGASNVPNGSNVQSVYNQTIENVTFDFKNVKNYEEMLHSLKDDRRFEKLITAMTIDRIAGGSSLAKNKSIR